MVNLMLAIEDEFGIEIPQRRMTPANFRTIAAIEQLVSGRGAGRLSAAMPLDRRAERLLGMLAAAGGARRAAPAGRPPRRAAARWPRWPTTPRRRSRVENRPFAGPAGALPIRLYAPLGAEHRPSPALVFFHGGGWVAGGLDTHDGLCRRLCDAAGCRVIAVDYRLAPEHPLPGRADDCLAGGALGRRRTPRRSASTASRLAVGGDSAGAGLAAAVAQIARDAGGPAIALQVLICPILDVGRRTRLARRRSATAISSAARRSQRDLADYAAPGVARGRPAALAAARAAASRGLPPA